jgi:hypothetical protein
MLPKEENCKAVKRILFYLKIFPIRSIIIHTSYHEHSVHHIEDHSNWVEFYPDAGEEIVKDLPPEKGQELE